MPQSNRGFSKSKMNKDFDERIVPEGEYRDALNIQISTSEDSDVGSAQTLLGNTLISSGLVPDGSMCVGSIAYGKKDKFASIRKAKLRLSNIKLEELTQILRGGSKQIKH